MEARAPGPPPESVVGPILVGNTLSWALWGLLTAQLLAHLAARNRRNQLQSQGPHSNRGSSSATSSSLARVGLGLRPRGRRKKQPDSTTAAAGGLGDKMRKLKGPWGPAPGDNTDDAFARADVNPWTISFHPRDDGHGISVAAYPRLPPPPPSSTGTRGRISRALGHNHGHRQAQSSTGTGTVTGTSNSPITPNPLVRAAPYVHTYPPAPSSTGPVSPNDEYADEVEGLEQDDASRSVSGLSPLLFLFLYALVCLQAIFGTVQFWYAIMPQSRGETDWAVVAAADCVGPIGA